MAYPMKAELEIKPFLKAINEFGIAEQQPCGVQVVEWVGLRGNVNFLHTALRHWVVSVV